MAVIIWSWGCVSDSFSRQPGTDFEQLPPPGLGHTESVSSEQLLVPRDCRVTRKIPHAVPRHLQMMRQ